MPDNLINKILLNQYRVDAFIASGGMGAVYRVWDQKRNVFLAMKVLHSDLADDPSIFKRFKREAFALEQLRHPNIVPFYGLFQDKGITFLFEEYISGQTLQEILREKGSLPIEDALIYFKGICAALGYAHRNNIIHCDVKPGNVLVSNKGNVYLADFGIARFTSSTMTSTGMAGSPAYMAPEQITGRLITPQTDVYSLGVMLFELLTGQKPFRGTEPDSQKGGQTTSERIHYSHLHLAPPNPSEINRKIAPGLSLVILCAMSKKPIDRYQSTQDLFSTLCHAANQPEETIPAHATVSKIEPDSVPIQFANNPIKLARQLVYFFIPAIILVSILLVYGLPKLQIPRQESPVNSSIPPTATQLSVIAPSPVTLTSQPGDFSVTAEAEPSPNKPDFFPTPSVTAQLISWKQGAIYFLSLENQSTRSINSINVAPSAMPVRVMSPANPNVNFSGITLSPDGKKMAFYVYGNGSWVVDDVGNGQYRQINSCSNPGWSGDGGRIICTDGAAFLTLDGYSGNILGEIPVHGLLPSWSPVRDEIVYAQKNNGIFSLWLLDLSNNQQVPLAETGSENYAPAWSPDGEMIAFQSNRNSPNSQVWVMDRNGKNPTQITNLGSWSRAPAWSPDGKWLAFVSDAAGSSGADYGEIFVISLMDGKVEQITSTKGNVYDWRVSWGK